ncbi:hypothetical protein BGZ72_003505 [Mortierella alpina]|nr:hypothetical protein BGZ72_003505 [Mortierella alpina]
MESVPLPLLDSLASSLFLNTSHASLAALLLFTFFILTLATTTAARSSPAQSTMSPKPLLLIQHRLSLSVGGIVRYRIKLNPAQLSNLDSLQFRIRNSSPVYRNVTPGSGPWKISVALVRNPSKTPAVPELVPFIGCAQVCRLDAKVADPKGDGHSEYEEGCNEWELEVLSEMVLQRNWVDVKVEVFGVPKESALGLVDSKSSSDSAGGGPDVEVVPQILQPGLVSCEYKDTAAICGPTFPDVKHQGDEGLHLVLLTHGIHGTWLDMLYIKEQIDAQNAHNGKTVTFLTDTNHAGTEEGIQMAGQRVALDILEFTGYCDTDQGKHLRRSASSTHAKHPSATPLTESASASTALSSSTSTGSAAKNRNAQLPFPRGFSKVSIIGHSLGGLINIYALGYIEDVTNGAFFNTIQPVHFVTMATPLLGIGFEHPWVLGFALSLGCIGQTGKDLALEYRSSKQLKRSSSPSSSSATRKEKSTADTETNGTTGATTTPTTSTTTTMDCTLDREPGPLLLAMARPGSVSNRILKRFQDRTSYANIENDMAVRFKTSSMMGIPTFDMDQFFSPEGAATQPRKNLYHSAVTSTLALLFPNVPTKAKFLSIAEEPSPIIVVDHVPAEPVKKKEGDQGEANDMHRVESTVSAAMEQTTEVGVVNGSAKGLFKKQKRSSKAPSSTSSSSSRSSSRSSSSSRETDVTKLSSSSSSSTLASKSRLELAQLVAEGYHAEMDWTKIGVFIAHEAHVQIIVRRKWYNLDGWKCVQDLVERFDFT